MGNKVTRLPTAKLAAIAAAPNADLVTQLEGLLAQARAGSLQAIAWAEVHSSRKMVTGVVASGIYERDIAAGIGDLFFFCYSQREADYSEREG